jgi:N-methylhydantoinase B/oxoprolinase/acetone carboxylase alpha subunit
MRPLTVCRVVRCVRRVRVRRAQVFKNGKTVFFVASRGHHADIGGITPGSMPPFSHTLAEEGACIKSFKLVKDGVFQEEVHSIFLLSILINYKYYFILFSFILF